jgi:ATP/maltotriose-dependent transcriptional regulator MalT
LECAERGLLLVPLGLEQFDSDASLSLETFAEAAKIGERFGNANLLAFGRLGQGESLIRLGQIREGVTFLDEVVVAATSGELAPIVTGTVYCAVLLQWQEIFDLRRAREWTAALNHWCEIHPDLMPFRGQCLVHRSEITLMAGDWPEALNQAQHARDLLGKPPAQPAVALAHYQQAELHRLRGELSEAEKSYLEASRLGRDPQPGLAQLRLAQGQLSAAIAMIRRAVDEAQEVSARARLLPALVEILLAANDLDTARAGAEELFDILASRDIALLRAIAEGSRGAVMLADGDARDALSPLRKAFAIWQDLDVPHEAARVRVLIGRACRALGDTESANLEFQAACSSFKQLGAVPDLMRTESFLGGKSEATPGGLTERELQVLKLVAAGKTNRAIGDELVISEKTVARHVSNILTKLDIPSRAAATAYAYEHRLI